MMLYEKFPRAVVHLSPIKDCLKSGISEMNSQLQTIEKLVVIVVPESKVH